MENSIKMEKESFKPEDIIQVVVKIAKSTITCDNGGWGSGGYAEGQLVVVNRYPNEPHNIGNWVQFEDFHANEGCYGYVESFNEGIIVYVEQ